MCDVSFSRDDYQCALDTYASEKKGKHALVELDRWYRSELRNALQSRHPKYITREELVKVVKWKLTRGTWRPKLVSYAEKHAASTIIDVSSAAFEFADDDRVQQAMEKLMELKGVEPVTCSAILSAAYPKIPFMSDEMLMAVNGKKEYTIYAYMKLYNGITSKMSNDMSTEEFECALWTKKHLPVRHGNKHDMHTIDDLVTKKRKV